MWTWAQRLCIPHEKVICVRTLRALQDTITKSVKNRLKKNNNKGKLTETEVVPKLLFKGIISVHRSS